MNRLPLSALAALLLAASSVRADLLFHGAAKNGDTYLVSLSDSATGASRWVAVGSTFADSTVVSFDPQKGIVQLKHGDMVTTASLPASHVKPEQIDVRDLLAMTPDELAAVGLYRLKGGDSGAKVARAHGMTIADLLALNPDVDFRRLMVGQILVLSAPPESTSPPLLSAAATNHS
jgi:hypothetical protein